MSTPIDSLRGHLFWRFEQLQNIWRESGVPYADQIRLTKDRQILGHWRMIVTHDEDGVPAITVPGFEDLGTTFEATARLTAAVQAAAITRAAFLRGSNNRPRFEIVDVVSGGRDE